MSNTNIQYQKGMVDSKTRVIEMKIQALLGNKEAEYDQLLAAFCKSECDQAAALREELQKEKEALHTVTEFYTRLVTMIQNASRDVEQVEDSHAVNHVTE